MVKTVNLRFIKIASYRFCLCNFDGKTDTLYKFYRAIPRIEGICEIYHIFANFCRNYYVGTTLYRSLSNNDKTDIEAILFHAFLSSVELAIVNENAYVGMQMYEHMIAGYGEHLSRYITISEPVIGSNKYTIINYIAIAMRTYKYSIIRFVDGKCFSYRDKLKDLLRKEKFYDKYTKFSKIVNLNDTTIEPVSGIYKLAAPGIIPTYSFFIQVLEDRILDKKQMSSVLDFLVDNYIITKDAVRVCDYISDHLKLSRKAYIALGVILKEKTILASELTKELQLPAGERLRSYVDPLIAHRIILNKGIGKGMKYTINPEFVANSKYQFTTTLKTIEPYRLKALIIEDLKFHPESLLSEIATRLPDVDFPELEKMVRNMAKEKKLIPKPTKKDFFYEISGTLTILLCLVLLSELGTVGIILKNLFKVLFGDFYFVVVVYLIGQGIFALVKEKWFDFKSIRFNGFLLFLFSLFLLVHISFIELYDINNQSILAQTIDLYKDSIFQGKYIASYGGGIVGAITSQIFVVLFNKVGALIFAIIFLVLSISFMTNLSIKTIGYSANYIFTKTKKCQKNFYNEEYFQNILENGV